MKKYPDNEILLNELLYVMNYTLEPDETIAVASKLLNRAQRVDIKYNALRFLAYAYKAKGDIDSARAAVEQLPELDIYVKYIAKLREEIAR